MKKLNKVLSISIVSFISFCGANFINALANNNEKEFDSSIRALTPHDGQTINILPGNLQEFWSINDLTNNWSARISQVDNLYTYNDELKSFSSVWSNDEAVWRIYDKYDLFKPVNNILKWEDNYDASSYKVLISQESNMANLERVYEVSGDNKSVVLDNPYTGCTYYWQVEANLGDGNLKKSEVFSFNVKNTQRTISVHGVSNTRDLGGYINQNGERTKQGIIYRGARLDNIDNKAKDEFLNKLCIKTDLDLRAAGEGKTNPSGVSQTFNFSCPYYTGGSTGIDSDTGGYKENLGKAISTFADVNNYPIYFHCSVGRDRTGAVALILNLLCDVDVETCFHEFMTSMFSVTGAHTKGAKDFYNNFKNYITFFNRYDGSKLSEKVEDYLIKECGVTHDNIVKIQNIMLGKTEISLSNTTYNEDNYNDYSRVTFIKNNYPIATQIVKNNSLLSRPEILGAGDWFIGDRAWNFNEDVVTSDLTLIFKSYDYVSITCHFVGVDKEDEVYRTLKNSVISFDEFAIDGYQMIVLNDEARPITSLYCDRDVKVNIMYIAS